MPHHAAFCLILLTGSVCCTAHVLSHSTATLAQGERDRSYGPISFGLGKSAAVSAHAAAGPGRSEAGTFGRNVRDPPIIYNHPAEPGHGCRPQRAAFAVLGAASLAPCRRHRSSGRRCIN